TFWKLNRLSRRFCRAKSLASSTSFSIERRFTPKWADKSGIADCFTCRDTIERRSVNYGGSIRRSAGTFFFIGLHFWKAVRRNRAKLFAFQSTLVDAERSKDTIP